MKVSVTYKILFGTDLVELTDDEIVAVARLAMAKLGLSAIEAHLKSEGFGVEDNRKDADHADH